MEYGLNVSIKSTKGSRSYSRLNTLKQRLISLARSFEEHYNQNLTQVTEQELFQLFNDMRNGIIKKKNGKEYLSVCDFVKTYKAFWHWYMKINRKQGKEIEDITQDLDTSRDKPRWVYLNEKQVKELCDKANYEYRVLIMFLYDSGIRSPSELLNIRVSDLLNDCKELQIRDETSKTFGRRIKLITSCGIIKEYIDREKLKSEDQLFAIHPAMTNRYLQRLSKKVFGDGVSEAGKKYSELTLYDFRHCSCCYWLPRYKSESALKYRFGWKKSDKIHYYSELLGMKDAISEEDLLIDVTKTEIENKLNKSESENTILKEKVHYLESKMKDIEKLVDVLVSKAS
jgi:integrase